MRLSITLLKRSANRAPIVHYDLFASIPKAVVEVDGFNSEIGKALLRTKPPPRTRPKWPPLQPKRTEIPAIPSWKERILAGQQEKISTYLSNQVKGFDASRFNERENEIFNWFFQCHNLSGNLYPEQYKSFLWFFNNSYPIPEYFFVPDLNLIPAHGTVRHLTVALRKSGGRDHTGQVKVRHIGGGCKRRIRLLNTSRTFDNPVTVIRYEHDPNRTTKIALVQDNVTQKLEYALMPIGIEPGTVIDNSSSIIHNGMTLPLREIPGGSKIFNLEIHSGKGGQLVRSAGTYATVMGMQEERGTISIKLPSGTLKEVDWNCKATIGMASNPEWGRTPIGSAGRARRLGVRPTVRGVAMNAVDHPHGGGKGGKSKGHHSQSPWGKICK